MDANADPLKLLCVGDAGVGKTCILNRLYGDDFGEPKEDWDYKKTSLTSEGVTHDVILTDTNGQERFRELTSASYKNVDIVFIVYAVDDQESFDHVEKWLGEVNRYVTNKSVPRVIVGNKADLDQHTISTEQGQALATSKGLRFLETSAKTQQNLPEMIKIAFASLAPAKEGGCCQIQ